MEENSKKEDINVLCKKYFTPELCDEPVTESKRTLKNKILTQLLKYGDSIVWEADANEISGKKGTDLCGMVLDTIEKCWEKWEEGLVPQVSYSTYFAGAIRQNRLSELKKKENQELFCLDVPVNDDEEDDETVSDNTGDDRNLTPEQYVMEKETMKDILTVIDRVFRLKKRSDWLKSGITGELYDDLHEFYDRYPEEHISRLSFVDMDIYNWKEKPTQKNVATYLGKDPGQMNRAIKTFLETVRENLGAMS